MTNIASLTSLTMVLILAEAGSAQFKIGLRPVAPAPVPQGVIPAPALPIPGQPIGRPSNTNPAPYLNFNPWGFYSGYLPFYPSWDEPANPGSVINNYYNFPAAPAVKTPAPRPMAPPVTKARLILKVPKGAVVTVSGKTYESDTGTVLTESPDLKPGEQHLFDVKVVWKEGDKTEERTRRLRLEAGDEKSLSYFAGK